MIVFVQHVLSCCVPNQLNVLQECSYLVEPNGVL